jgi:hypothetical protein
VNSMLETIYGLINFYTAPLYTILYKSQYFFIDCWSFVHFISGFVIVSLTLRRGGSRPLMILMAVLLSWEVLEITFIYMAIHVFRPETIPDQFTDIIIGFIGGFFGVMSAAIWRKGVDEQGTP